jgi:tRNA C32,U32 (ribose-2'-O)-methylase TrmJ
MVNPEIVQKTEIAKQAIIDAQHELEKVVDELDVAPRAQKRHVGEALKDALQRLRVAQNELAALKELLIKE